MNGRRPYLCLCTAFDVLNRFDVSSEFLALPSGDRLFVDLLQLGDRFWIVSKVGLRADQ